MFWEIWTKGFACIGQLALVLTVVCLLDSELSQRVAAFWAAYSESHRIFRRSLSTLFQDRLKELKAQERKEPNV